MNDFDPTQNRVPTCLLTADELAALKAAEHGWDYWANIEQEWRDTPEPAFQRGTIYRAKPAPAPTLSITVNGVTNVVAAPVTEALVYEDLYWLPFPSNPSWAFRAMWMDRPADVERLKRGLIHRTEAAASAHAMAMVGLKAEGV